MTLFVDHRWKGNFGIGRYSAEVLPRLSLESSRLNAEGAPLDPLGMFAGFTLGSPSLIYSPGFNAGFTRARQVLTVHDLIHLKQPQGLGMLKKLFYERVLKPAVLKSGLLFTDSEASKSDITEWLGRHSVDIVNAGCGISSAFVSEGPVASMAEGEFLYVGNLKTHKNAEVLLDALKLRPDYRILWITSSGLDVQRLAADRKVERQIRVQAGLTDMELAAHYRGSSGLLFPSILEGFGLPPLEALGTGTPVAYSVACDVVAENVGNAGVGVTDTFSPEAWGEAMDQLLAYPKATLQNVAARMHQMFSWSVVSDRVSASLREAL